MHQVIFVWVWKSNYITSESSNLMARAKSIDFIVQWRWKTKFLVTSLERLFWILSDRIFHHIHIVRTSCCQLPTKIGDFLLFCWGFWMMLVVCRCLSQLMRHCFRGRRELPFSVEMSPVWLKHIHSVLCVLTWRPMPAVIRSWLCSRVSARAVAFARSVMSSVKSASVIVIAGYLLLLSFVS